MLKNKKGTHVGKIISFIVFIVFITFTYIVLQPTVKIEKNKQALLDHLKLTLNENLTIKIKIFSVSLLNPVSENCIQLKDFTAYTKKNITFAVHNFTGSNKDSGVSLNKNNLVINKSLLTEDFFKVFYSKDFNDVPVFNSSSCATLTENLNYSIKAITSDRKIYDENIRKLIYLYSSNYSGLKEYFKIPRGNEFGFLFEYENGTIIETPGMPEIQNIYAEQIPIQYITKDAYVESGFLTIKVW